jgi:hypothetical protein
VPHLQAKGLATADPNADLAATAAAFRDWMEARAIDLEPFGHELPEPLAASIERFKPLQRMLWDDGWYKLGWAPELGGLGGSPVQRFVVLDELAAAGYVIPELTGTVEIIAPMLVRYAPELARTHVPAGVRGDHVWCQGFSEPDAGSDLGSLRTRAVPDGDGFRISGQKAWSSFATVADWCCVLARTGEPDSGYRGLSMFWVDLTSPGVRVVPTRCETGREETAEVFYDDVYVPGDHLIGPVGHGWTVVMYLMQFERGAYAWGRQAEMHTQLTRLIGGQEERAAADNARVVGDAYLSLLAVRAQSRDTIAQLAAGNDLGPEISVDKILLSSAEQTMTESARALLWPRLELEDSDEATWWRSRWAYSRITTVYGGAGEVQRDLVAERLLGLPRWRPRT